MSRRRLQRPLLTGTAEAHASNLQVYAKPVFRLLRKRKYSLHTPLRLMPLQSMASFLIWRRRSKAQTKMKSAGSPLRYEAQKQSGHLPVRIDIARACAAKPAHLRHRPLLIFHMLPVKRRETKSAISIAAKRLISVPPAWSAAPQTEELQSRQTIVFRSAPEQKLYRSVLHLCKMKFLCV